MSQKVSLTSCKICIKVNRGKNENLENHFIKTFSKEKEKFHCSIQEFYFIDQNLLKLEEFKIIKEKHQKEKIAKTNEKFLLLFEKISSFPYNIYFQTRELFEFTYNKFENLANSDDLLIVSLFIVLNMENSSYLDDWSIIYEFFPELLSLEYLQKLSFLQNTICQTYLKFFFPINVFCGYIYYISNNFIQKILILRNTKKSTPKTRQEEINCLYEKMIIYYCCKLFQMIDTQEYDAFSIDIFYFSIFSVVFESLNKYFENEDHFNTTVYFMLLEELKIKNLDQMFICIEKLKNDNPLIINI